jgi:hypothetical protein
VRDQRLTSLFRTLPEPIQTGIIPGCWLFGPDLV